MEAEMEAEMKELSGAQGVEAASPFHPVDRDGVVASGTSAAEGERPAQMDTGTGRHHGWSPSVGGRRPGGTSGSSRRA